MMGPGGQWGTEEALQVIAVGVQPGAGSSDIWASGLGTRMAQWKEAAHPRGHH